MPLKNTPKPWKTWEFLQNGGTLAYFRPDIPRLNSSKKSSGDEKINFPFCTTTRNSIFLQCETLRTTFWRDLARLKNRQLFKIWFFGRPGFAFKMGGNRRISMENHDFTKKSLFFSRLGFVAGSAGYLTGFGRFKSILKTFLKNKKPLAALGKKFFVARGRGRGERGSDTRNRWKVEE